ncbi:MAG: hypothetical protein RR367_08915 [Clostridia bacterium]
MKKVYVILLVMITAIALGAWYLFSFAYERANQTAELAKYINDGLVQQSLTAQYQGEQHVLTSDHADALLTALKRGANEAKDTDKVPSTAAEPLMLTLGEMRINVYPTGVDDEVVFEKILRGQVEHEVLSGYRSFHWLLLATGFAV